MLKKVLMDRAPPFVTAKSWAVFDVKSEWLLFGRAEAEKWEIASLTKLMVTFTTIKLCERLGINMELEMITVSQDCTDVNGTSARLKEGD